MAHCPECGGTLDGYDLCDECAQPVYEQKLRDLAALVAQREQAARAEGRREERERCLAVVAEYGHTDDGEVLALCKQIAAAIRRIEKLEQRLNGIEQEGRCEFTFCGESCWLPRGHSGKHSLYSPRSST